MAQSPADKLDLMLEIADSPVLPSEHNVLDEEGVSTLDDDAHADLDTNENGHSTEGTVLLTDMPGYPGSAHPFDHVIVANWHTRSDAGYLPTGVVPDAVNELLRITGQQHDLNRDRDRD